MGSEANHLQAGGSFGATRLWMTERYAPLEDGGVGEAVMESEANHLQAGGSFGATRLWMTERYAPLDDGTMCASG